MRHGNETTDGANQVLAAAGLDLIDPLADAGELRDYVIDDGMIRDVREIRAAAHAALTRLGGSA